MSIPYPEQLLRELTDQQSNFDSRSDIGPMAGLIQRELRYFMGNPVRYYTQTSTSNSNVVVLPVDGRARTAVIQAWGGAIIYRDDGTPPSNAGDQQLTQGGQIILTGFQSIQSFMWAAAGLTSVTIAITYYD
jgi:hypothetical protein